MMGLMRERSRIDRNLPDAILMSYDLQSGSYTTIMDDPEHCPMKKRVNDSIADVLCPSAQVPVSLLESVRPQL